MAPAAAEANVNGYVVKVRCAACALALIGTGLTVVARAYERGWLS